MITLLIDVNNTTSCQPLSPQLDKYVAYVVYERLNKREWIMHFIVGKSLSHLLEMSIDVI